jgi:hypothetical protein
VSLLSQELVVWDCETTQTYGKLPTTSPVLKFDIDRAERFLFACQGPEVPPNDWEGLRTNVITVLDLQTYGQIRVLYCLAGHMRVSRGSHALALNPTGERLLVDMKTGLHVYEWRSYPTSADLMRLKDFSPVDVPKALLYAETPVFLTRIQSPRGDWRNLLFALIGKVKNLNLPWVVELLDARPEVRASHSLITSTKHHGCV